jgi:putative ATP-dependent endonuclease of OLD family
MPNSLHFAAAEGDGLSRPTDEDKATPMRLSAVKIKHWRSIREVSFSTGRVTALVGANNAGKTAILSALNFLMGPTWPSTRGLEDGDFYRRQRENGLKVEVWFEEGAGLHSAWYEVAADEEGQTGARVQYSPDGKVYPLNGETRDRFPMIYIEADRSFERQFGTSRWSLFGQAIRKLEEDFGAKLGEDAKEKLGYHLGEAQQVLRTPLYDTFVSAIGQAFNDHVRHTRHSVEVGFRAFDPLHFYRSLQPFLTEDGEHKSASEAGSGLRNMIVLALFRAYGQTFKGDSVVAIEEPELFLHPHAQRGLMRMFREIAANGTQILYSTHSSAFVSIERFDDVVIVERCPDIWDEEVCSSVRSLSGEDLVNRHRKNRPGETFEIDGIRARFRHNLGPEHTEALFGRAVVLVEGATEAAALPFYADSLNMNLDALGISIVNARGKDSLEALYHLYAGFGFPVYVIFDNDVGKRGDGKDRQRRQESNRRLTRLLRLPVSDAPEAAVLPNAGIMGLDFETTVRAEVELFEAGLYDRLASEAGSLYATESKPIKARYIAEYLGMLDYTPPTVRFILRALAALVGAPGPDMSPEAPTDDVRPVRPG